jgi:hypothetical protein
MEDRESTKKEFYAPWGIAITRPSEEEFRELNRVLQTKLKKEREEWKQRAREILKGLTLK